MCIITREQCEIILQNYFEHRNYKLLNYSTNSANDASVGLMSSVSSLKIRVLIDGKIQKVSFFVKSPPKNAFQLDVVTKSCCFKKEAAFFGKLFSGMRAFLLYKSIPKCYLPDCESMIVLEDLSAEGYRNSTNSMGIDLKHTYVSLKALADIHAASLLYEHKIGRTWDEFCPVEILRPWFNDIKSNPGYFDNRAAAKLISSIIDLYFADYPQNTIKTTKKYLFDFSQHMQKSKKYRNVITHQDLWCNNIMFKYDEKGVVNEAAIIDFQMYGYNPPTLDLLILIYCNTDKKTRDLHIDNLIDYYYKCLCQNISNHNVNPAEILTKEQFYASMEETMPTALCAATIFLQIVLVPENEMYNLLSNLEKFQNYFMNDRNIVLDLMVNYKDFRNRILIAVEDLLNYMNNKNRI